MNRYGKAGLALLGIGGLAGFISLLGGPNVFSTFSSSISTLFPEAETPAVEEKPQEKLDETPVVAKAEELQKIEEIAQTQSEPEVTSPVVGQEETPEPEKLIVEPTTPSREEPVAKSKLASFQESVAEKPKAPEPVQPKSQLPALSGFTSLIKGFGTFFQGTSTTSQTREIAQYRGGRNNSPQKQIGSGAEGSGGQCATPREVRWIRLGEKCEWNEY